MQITNKQQERVKSRYSKNGDYSHGNSLKGRLELLSCQHSYRSVNLETCTTQPALASHPIQMPFRKFTLQSLPRTLPLQSLPVP